MISRGPADERAGLVGRKLGDFVVQARIGEGGYGTVYLADQPALGRSAVVVKVLKVKPTQSETSSKRFLREARLASSLDHPYAAHIYAFGAEPDGLLWIAMELVRGVTLERMLKRQTPVAAARFVPLFQRICEVVHAAHELGIVHRDIKPANIMVISRAGHQLPKLLDFGIAKYGREVDDDGSVEADWTSDHELSDVTGDLPATRSTRELRVLRAAELGADAPMTPTHTTPSASPDFLLTEAGQALGSPPYMAPEQWQNRHVGPRADLYALGVLVYRVLTGRYPFNARTAATMAEAHLRTPVPSLGLPDCAALDAVLARAMAKQQDARYANVLELADALRRATGADPGVEPLPALEPPLLEVVLADAPQPIAEAVALLDAARTLEQAEAAIGAVVHVAARYLALVALSARVHGGAGADGDLPEVGAALQRLRAQTLSDVEWITLTRALVRPFAQAADTHVVPDLVAFFYEPDGHERVDPFPALLAPPETTDAGSAGPASQDAAMERLRLAVSAVGRLLRQLGFLSSYPLAVPRDAGVERWMGLRRPRRAAELLSGPPLIADRPLLVDANGTALLSLWPLMQVAAPLPGATYELFLLDGPSRHGARLAALPGHFQHHEDELWGWLRSSGLAVDDEGAISGREENAPYLGLSSFTPDDAPLFFGRERESEIAMNRLRAQAFLAIVGPSGAGKSSFVQAGVLPTLGPRSRTLYLRPGPAPLQALSARLAREGIDCSSLTDGSRAAPAELRAQLAALGARERVQLVLFVDQFEELFTQCADVAERARFAAILCGAAADASSPVRVVITLRDDFLIRAQELPVLRDPLAAGLQLLATPAPADLRRIVVEPARSRGYVFEDERLPDEMLAQVAGEPGALPLLSFTAQRLWDQRDRHFKQLTRRAYLTIGGVAGALARHAEDLLGAMTEPEQALAREAFRHLLTAEGTRASLGRAELVAVLGHGALAEGVIEKLIGARLAVAQEGEGGVERIEIIHETLAQAWPRLLRWRQEDAEGARLRDQLRAAALQWQDRGRPRDLLWRGDTLLELRGWRVRHGANLTPIAATFAQASIAEDARGRRRRVIAISCVIATLLFAFAGMTRLYRRSLRAEADSRAQLAATYEDRGRGLLLEHHDARALDAFAAALRLDRDTPSLRRLVHHALDSLGQLEHTFSNDGAQISTAAFADGRVFVGGNSPVVRAFDARDGHLLWQSRQEGREVVELAPSPDGARVAILLDTGVVAVLDGATGASRGQSPVPVADVPRRTQARRLAWSDRGCVVARYAQVVRCIDGQTGQPRWTTRRRLEVRRMAVAPGVAWIGLDDGTLERVAIDGGAVAAPWRSSFQRIMGLEAVLDGTRLLVADATGQVAVLDAATGTILRRHADAFADLARPLELSPSRRLMLRGGEHDVIVTELDSGRQRAVLPHPLGLISAVFLDDNRVATGGGDGVIRIWELDVPQPVASFDAHGDLVFLSAAPDARLLSWGDDQHARLWRPHAASRVAEVAVTGPVFYVSAREQRLLIGHATGISELALGGERPRPLVQATLVDTNGAGALGPLAAIRVDGATRSALRVDPVSGQVATIWTPPNAEALAAVAIDGTGARLLVSGAHRALLIDVARRTPIETWARVELVALSERTAALARADSSIELVDAASGKSRCHLTGHSTPPHVLTFSQDGALLVSAAPDRTVRVWDIARCEARGQPFDHSRPLTAAAVGGDLLIVGDEAGTIVLADLSTHAPLFTLESGAAPSSLSLSSDGARLYAGGDSSRVISWDVAAEAGDGDQLLRAIAQNKLRMEGTQSRIAMLKPRAGALDRAD